jgi:hypothetical protein
MSGESKRWQCFEEYAEDSRRSFRVKLDVARTFELDKLREDRCLTPVGRTFFIHAVHGYLCGCRDDADELVAKGYEFLQLADALGEKQKSLYAPGFSEGGRSTVLSFLHYLRTGETLDRALADARNHYARYYRESKTWDRGSANLAAPELLYLGADDVVFEITKKLYGRPGATARPGGLLGDALRMAQAEDEPERERLKEKLRKRMPLHLFRWMSRGLFDNVAFMLHAVYPKPAGRPSGLIEEAWTYMPEIERVPGYPGWDVKRKRWLKTKPG